MDLITATQMQEIDRRTIDKVGIPGRVLMESAGRGCVSALYGLVQGRSLRRVAVVCGCGNNGGDGFVVARYLVERGIETTVFLLGKRGSLCGEAWDNFELLAGLPLDVREVEEADLATVKNDLGHSDLVVDALFGTGLARDVGGVFAGVIGAMNQSGKPIVSVDIPSGICADTGRVMGCAVRAQATATFCRPKPGHFLYPGRSHAGRLSIVDIGIPERVVGRVRSSTSLITSSRVMDSLCTIADDGHKGSRGHLALVAGSKGKSGAAILCARAAVAFGAGLVSAAIPDSINTSFESTCLEAMSFPMPADFRGGFATGETEHLDTFLAGKEALAIGPGLGMGEGALEILSQAISSFTSSLVVDADALNLLAANASLLSGLRGRAVLTPHPKEFSRLCGASVSEIQADRIALASAYAQAKGVHLVLKGAATVVAHPDGSVGVNPTGNSLLATGGSGDILTGMIGAFLAQGYPLKEAAELSVYLHGEVSNRLWEEGFRAGVAAPSFVEQIPKVLSDALSHKLSPRVTEHFSI